MRSFADLSARLTAASRLVRAARSSGGVSGFAARRTQADPRPLLLVNLVAFGAIAASLLAGFAA